MDRSTDKVGDGLGGRGMLALVAILIPFVALSSWYNHYRFDSIFETGYTTYAKRAGADLFSGTSFMAGLAGLLISPGKGYFYFTPVAVLFFFSYLNFFKRHAAEAVSFLAIILSYILFISKYKYWHGDWGWGPRFIVVVTPFFIIPIAEILSSGYWNKRKIIRMSVFAVVIISVLIQIAAISINYKKFFYTLAFDRNVKFQVDAGEGIPPITVPPNEIYYDWRQSQIVSQFRFIAETGQTINEYRFATPGADASFAESIKSQPMMSLYDLWWVYKYFLGGTYFSFVLAFMFILIASVVLIILWRLTIDT